MNQTLVSGIGREYLMSLGLASKDILANTTPIQLLFSIIFVIAIFLFLEDGRVIDAPYAGYRSWFEPTFLVRARFFRNAQSVISSGYNKVSKNQRLSPYAKIKTVQKLNVHRSAQRYRYRGITPQIPGRVEVVT
jgi:hypothetical protein